MSALWRINLWVTVFFALVTFGCLTLLVRQATTDVERELQAAEAVVEYLSETAERDPASLQPRLTASLRQRLPQLRVLFFSMHDELPLVRQALDAGASGYLTKNSDPEVLIEAVRRILAGHAYIEQPLATQLACNPQQRDASDPRLQSMTQRELEIFVMLAKGTPTRQIAEQLCISPRPCPTT